ncbi:rhodanese-related sulfurtransferase [Spirochaeta cellobiosiphila]|uniref:oxygen-dependent tRNA uridine(34) hydroxylase TrhO n=1 Tax=Spirochaeta cellobiosiphila TaxID=504483 RepID=UPI0004299173|nr:rhodanese-related sulfurtransferase [Spirochaeta cellobiosiphila]
MSKYVIAALYQFKDFPEYKEEKSGLLHFCKKWHINGTLLLASEGINGTVAGSEKAIEALRVYIENTLGFTNLEYKLSYQESGKPPFYKMKVKLKKEIVTMGIEGMDPTTMAGTYVSPSEWNELIQDPEVLLIDTRNSYEFKIGTFKGAMDPQTRYFRQFPDWVRQKVLPQKPKKVAMFCTGGIRCEKATSFLKSEGVEEVYHLKGGILKYIEDIDASESLWEGECFVFDNRVSVNQELEPGIHRVCYGCGEPLTKLEIESDLYEEGISCPHCYDSLTEETRQRLNQRNDHRQKVNASA